MLEKIQMWGGRIDKIYCCPHADYENCECRKPNTKFLRDAKKEFNLNLKRSIVIGNSDTDTMLAKNAGCLSILYTKKSLVDFLTVPDYTARDWEQVIYIIKNNIKKIEEDLHVYN